MTASFVISNLYTPYEIKQKSRSLQGERATAHLMNEPWLSGSVRRSSADGSDWLMRRCQQLQTPYIFWSLWLFDYVTMWHAPRNFKLFGDFVVEFLSVPSRWTCNSFPRELILTNAKVSSESEQPWMWLEKIDLSKLQASKSDKV